MKITHTLMYIFVSENSPCRETPPCRETHGQRKARQEEIGHVGARGQRRLLDGGADDKAEAVDAG